MTAALFVDRDGVINIDDGYIHRVDQVVFVPGIFDLARCVVAELGWHLVVITNQSGIGRGYFSETEFDTLMRWIRRRFLDAGAPISRVYHCPFHPEHGRGRYRRDHPWRKPRPGMIFQAAEDLGLCLAKSALLGDSMSDIEAGFAAGVGLCIRLDIAQRSRPIDKPPHLVVNELQQVPELLRRWHPQTRIA